MCGSHILLGPTLGADLHGVVLVAVVVENRGGSTGEIGVNQITNLALQIVYLVLKVAAAGVSIVVAVVGLVCCIAQAADRLRVKCSTLRNK